ncbi:MAG: hypothetical protein ABI678_11590 [Kofleriaceae bacterium]
MRSVLLVIALVIPSVACKGKPKHKPPPPNLGPIDPNAKPSVTPNTELPDLVLPHGTGKPVKTTEALPLKKLLELQQLTWKGFKAEPHAINPAKGMEVRHITNDKPKIAATVTVAPCTAESVLGPCVASTLPAWQALEAELKKMIPTEIRPSAKFEIGVVKFHDTDLVYTFQLGEIAGTLDKGSNAGQGFVAYTYAYILYYNDGANQIRVVAEYKDDAPTKAEDLLKLTPRSDLENTAKGFFDAFTSQW